MPSHLVDRLFAYWLGSVLYGGRHLVNPERRAVPALHEGPLQHQRALPDAPFANSAINSRTSFRFSSDS